MLSRTKCSGSIRLYNFCQRAEKTLSLIEKRLKKLKKFFVFVSFLFGCSFLFRNIQVAKLPSEKEIFVTSGDISASYVPLGFIHIKKYGLKLLWFIPLVTTDLNEGINLLLIEKAKELSADGIINVEYKYTISPATFVEQISTIGTLIPSVTIRGLAVKLEEKNKNEKMKVEKQIK